MQVILPNLWKEQNLTTTLEHRQEMFGMITLELYQTQMAWLTE